MVKHTLKIMRCSRFLKHVWPFYNIMHERVNIESGRFDVSYLNPYKVRKYVEYGFALTRILPYKERIFDYFLIWENIGRKSSYSGMFYAVICKPTIIDENFALLLYIRKFMLGKDKILGTMLRHFFVAYFV